MNVSAKKDKASTSDINRSTKAQVVRWICGVVIIAGIFAAAIFFDEYVISLFPKDWDAKVINIFKYSFVAIMLCCALCLYRVMRGPTAPDRAVSLDMVGTLIVGICAILGIVSKRSWYIDIGIIWALQSFIGSLALAKYLEGRHLDE